MFKLKTILAVVAGAWLVAPAASQETPSPKVAASAICLGVEEHEPVGTATTFVSDVDRLYCWTRIVDAKDQTVVHAWIHEGTTRARVELKIGSPSWRTFSSKQILPAWTGHWEVKVMTLDGLVLESIGFDVE